MLNVLLSSILNVGIKSNIVADNGVGPLLFSREKRYGFFRYLSMLFLIIGVCICSIAMYFLQKYVLVKYELAEFKVFIVVLIAGLYSLIVSAIWKKSTYFGRYLYASSCSFAFDLAYIIFVVMGLNLELEIAEFFMMLVAISAVIVVMNLVIGVFVNSINKSNLNINFRNISARLFLFAIISFLLHYLKLFVA